MSDDPEKLIKKAEKLISPGFFKAIFSSNSDRLEEAFDLYSNAAGIYKIKKEYKKAAECFLKCAFLKENLKESAAFSYKDALDLYQKINDVEEYNKTMEKCISAYLKNGKYADAAKLEFDRGKENEKNNKYKEAMESYERTLDFYNMDKDEKKAAISNVKTAIADLICIGDFKDKQQEAKNIYETLGNEKLESQYGKYLATDFFAKSVFCYLAFDDYISAKAYYHKYCDIDSSLAGSPEGKFIESIIDTFQNAEEKESDMKFVVTFYLTYKKERNNKGLCGKWMDEMTKKIEEKLEEAKNAGNKNYAEEDDFK